MPGEPDAAGVTSGVLMRLPLVILTTTLMVGVGCEKREPVALDQVPAPVTAAAVAAMPGFTATTVTSEAEDGGIAYKLEGTVAGLKAEIEIEVAADGKATVEETESEVPLDQVPATIRDAALTAAPGLLITGAKREVKKAQTEWTIAGSVTGKDIEVEVQADGSTEVESRKAKHEGKGH